MHPHYSSRIGDRFLETRAQLGAALFSLTALADESLTTQPAAASLRAMEANLRRPFVFLAVGEASAGKSSLLNALFGREFSDPDEGRTSIFKYGAQLSDTALSASVVERRRPLPFLRDFQLVDTASASAILSDHEARIEELAPVADVIIFVLSVLDPWSEGAWDLIAAVHEKWRKPIVVAVQHADERPGREVEAICRHVERTAAARLGREFPVFAVSAKAALLARTSGFDRDRLWRESGFGPLEACIDEIVGGALGRGRDLPAAADAGREVLRGIAAEVRRLVDDVSAEYAANAAADEVITRAEAGCAAVLESLRERMEAGVARCRRQGVNSLRARVQGRSWLGVAGPTGARRWVRSFHRNVAGMVRAAADREVEAALRSMIAHFQEAADRLLAACDQPSQAVGADRYWLAAREVGVLCRQLAEEVALTVAEHLAQDGVDRRVQALLASSARCVGAAAGCAAGGVLAGLGLGVFLSPGAGLAAAAAGLACATWFATAASRRGEEAVRCYTEETPLFHAGLVTAVNDAFSASAAASCGQLREALAPLSEHCAQRGERVRPICAQVDGLEKVLRQIASRS